MINESIFLIRQKILGFTQPLNLLYSGNIYQNPETIRFNTKRVKSLQLKQSVEILCVTKATSLSRWLPINENNPSLASTHCRRSLLAKNGPLCRWAINVTWWQYETVIFSRDTLGLGSMSRWFCNKALKSDFLNLVYY